MDVKKTLLVLWVACWCWQGHAQKVLPVKTVCKDSVVSKELKTVVNKKFQSDSVQLPGWISKIKNQLSTFGYFNTTFKTLYTDTTILLYISLGNKYNYQIRKFIDTANLLQADIKNISSLLNTPTQISELEKASQKFLNQYENNGYPFASLYIQPQYISDSIIISDLVFYTGPKFIIDDIEVIGDAKIRQSYLEYYMGLKKGDDYNESMIAASDNKLRQLGFVEVYKPMQIFFEGNKAKIRIFLNQSKANNFDGVVGLQPDETGKRSFVLTGEFHLQLPNMFNRGVETSLDYRSFAGNSQDFKTKINIPNFLKSPIGLDAGISILKYDTTYIDVNTQIGFRYQPNPSNYIRFFYEHQNIFLLNVDTAAIRQSKQLPNFNDLKAGNYGLTLSMKKLDFNPNPLKGYTLEATTQAGLRSLEKNSQVNSIILYSQQGDAYKIYDSIKLNTVQYKLNFKSNLYIRVGKYSCLVWHVDAGSNFINHIFQNDMYRIGGLNTIRGFNEQSIFATSYILSNYEYRYLLSTYSHAVVFANSGWYEKKWDKEYIQNILYSFGAGVQLKTGGGILKLYYALGQTAGTPFTLANGRVHLGYVNSF